MFSFLFGKKRLKNNFSEAGQNLPPVDNVQSEVIDVAIHQLKTPLVGIKWSLKMLINQELGPLNEAQKTLLTQSYESNEKIISTIDGILHADRVEAGRNRFTFFDVDIKALVETKVAELYPNARSKNISIKVNSESNLPVVSIDANKIGEVMQNLLENSIKYTNPGGEIDVSITKSRDFVVVAVIDDGIGIPEDQKKNVFQKFYRAVNATVLDPNGSGLGLFVAKGIVEKHGGKMWFESKEGRGSSFYFTIPSKK